MYIVKNMIAAAALIGCSILSAESVFAKEECNSPNGCYVNSSHHLVPRPHVNAVHDKRATALCRDGTESYSQHHSGTCSGHHGVERWYR